MSVMGMASSRREALESEHTTSGDILTLLWAIHSRMDWPTRAMDGAQNSTVLVPRLSGSRYSSARRSDMRVLPVPHAMIALQRSLSSKARSILETASSWWGRRS